MAIDMKDAFSNILGQPNVRDFLRASVSSDRVVHAYLFVGPAGSNKTQAAYALATSLVCPKGKDGPLGGACGDCDNCNRARKKTHPDIKHYSPEGASGYLIGQIRDIASDTSLAPIQASRKVYIIDRVDMLSHAAANAFLKTLEEPPDDVVLILLGRTRESVLPTIASRCQVVPFRHIPPSEAAGIVSQNTGASIDLSKQAIEACSGSISKAIEFLRAADNKRLLARNKLMGRLSTIRDADDWELMELARQIVEDSKAPLDSLRAKMEEEIAENQDFLAKSAIRRIEEANKRKLTQSQSDFLKQSLSMMASWLRDVEAIAIGEPDLVINTDQMPGLSACGPYLDISQVSNTLYSIRQASAALDYNVSPETCIDVVLIKIRKVFNGENRTS